MTASPQVIGNATLAQVGQSATSVTIFTAAGQQRRRLVFNDSDGILYLAFTATAASVTAYSVKVAAGGYYEFPLPLYGGVVTGIWTGGTTGGAKTTVY